VAHPQIAAFARLAEGADAPTRRIAGQATLLGRTMHAIHYDELHDEIVVPQPFAQAILTFRGGAVGEEPPLRIIQGSRTRLSNGSEIVIDPVNNEIYMNEMVFRREANGDVAPVRILNHSVDGVDPVTDLVISIARDEHAPEGAERLNLSLQMFPRTAVGAIKPVRVIKGPRTMLANLKRVRVINGWILVVRDGYEAPGPQDGQSFVAAWRITDEGDVPPRMTIGGPGGKLQRPRGLDIDPKNQTIMVSDKSLNAVLTYHVPELFEQYQTASTGR
jgi:hypothetical protein